MKIKLNRVKALAGTDEIEIELQDLMIFFGGNNCGKSSILLGAAQVFMQENTSDYISTNRLETHGNFVVEHMGNPDYEAGERKNRKSFQGVEPKGPDPIVELSLADPDTFQKITTWFNENFETIEVNKVEKSAFHTVPEVLINKINPKLQGSGSRSVLSIVVQLFNSKVELLCIDEPEQSIEPKTQKMLFELIKNASLGLNGVPKKKVLIATHSHIFIDKIDLTNNFKVTKINGQVKIEQISNELDLQNCTYNLLGNSPTDLFFPGNIILVEGRSDAIFIEAIYKQMIKIGIIPPKKLVFHFLDGYDGAYEGMQAVVQMLKTQSYTPIYKDKICGIFDKPKQNVKIIEQIRNFVNDNDQSRFVLLDEDAIEYYYPEQIISKIFKVEIPDYNTPQF